ncbi:MAG: EAL domain-containing protein [Acidimicrobiia bacterium]|nr:EAL domain-containing protein [Acidimicrobiia bacterium]
MANAPPAARPQEALLLEYVQQLEKIRNGRKMLHLHLSQLRPYNRHDTHLRTAAANFDPIVRAANGQIFPLRNGDIFFCYKKDIQVQVDNVVQRLRYLFGEDPLVSEEGAEGKEFATILDATTQYDDILYAARTANEAESKRGGEEKTCEDASSRLKARQEKGEPLTPDVLARIETALVRADLSNLVRRQYACSIDENNSTTQIFSELFISINDLRETLLPGVNLTSNRWLFQHLTETLDKRMLALLSKTDRFTVSGDISFNVNVRTLLAPEFMAFDDNVSAGRRGSLIIELQKEDIFSDLGTYLFAREFLQNKGYRVCLDGLTYQTLDIIDRRRLGADMAKLFWTPEMAEKPEGRDKIKRLFDDASKSLVLCRCDSSDAIEFGRSVGIELYQGRYIENLIAEDNRRRDLLKIKRRLEREAEGADGIELAPPPAAKGKGREK